MIFPADVSYTGGPFVGLEDGVGGEPKSCGSVNNSFRIRQTFKRRPFYAVEIS